jgi:hypothetical protein
MTSPLLRLFAVCWWLVVAGSVAVAVCGLLISWADYHSSREYTAYQADLDALAKLPRVLPDTTSNQRTPFLFNPDNPVPPDPTWYVVGSAVVLLLSLLPFSIMTVTRWIITARWRLGPRW